MRNTVYYVLVFVPGATALAFFLALVVNNRALKGRGFFRTAFYFPSITSSVAISITFLFLFQSTGVINTILGWFGIQGPLWFNDARGLIHIVLDNLGIVDPQNPPGWLADTEVFGLSLWQWISGPSVAMCALLFLAIWTTSGTFMLFFLAGLQNISQEVEEASAVDGATKWQRFRYITMPLMRPSIALVVTLAIIGSWQVFDQVFIMTQGAPGEDHADPGLPQLHEELRRRPVRPGRGDRLRAVPDHHHARRPAAVHRPGEEAVSVSAASAPAPRRWR